MPDQLITPPDLEEDWADLRAPNTGGRGHVRYLTGKVIGYLEVGKQVESNKHGMSQWECRCRLCDTLKVYTRAALTSGRVKSCGCIKAKRSWDPAKGPPPDEPKPLRRNRTFWATLRNEGGEPDPDPEPDPSE